jgi:hypothetical protein
MAGEYHQADELTSFVMLREISARPEARARLVHRKYDSHYHSLKARLVDTTVRDGIWLLLYVARQRY